MIIFHRHGDLGNDLCPIGMDDRREGISILLDGHRVARRNACAEDENPGSSGESIKGEEKEKKSDAFFHAPDLSENE